MRIVIAVLALCLCASGASVDGRLTDPGGGPVAGAEITAERNGVKLRTQSDLEGRFTFANLTPGEYRFTVSHPGFKTVRRSSRLTTTLKLDVKLELEEQHEVVTVTAEAPAVDLSPAQNADAVVVEPSTLDALPVLGRDTLGTLSVFTDPDAPATIIVDGVETDARSLPASAIQNVKINQNPYSAEFSRHGRGRIEITTRQGTPDFHGSARVSIRDSDLDARNAFAPARPTEHRRVWEASLTGPITKNTSFSASVDYEDEQLQSIVYARTPAGLLNQTIPTPESSYDSFLRLTRRFGDKHVLSARFESEQWKQPVGDVGGFQLEDVATTASERSKGLTLQHTAFPSARLIFETSLSVEKDSESIFSASPGRRIVVSDAFISGGAQVSESASEKEIQLRHIVSFSAKNHILRFGVQIPDWSYRLSLNRSNFGGTYYFATLNDYLAGNPYSFTQQRGRPDFSFNPRTIGAFVQDSWQVRPNLTLETGVRYESQNFVSDSINFAPRASIAYAPGKSRRQVFRAGAGIFYDRVPAGTLQDVLQTTDLRLSQVVISDPSWPEPFDTPGTTTPPGIARFAEGLSVPYGIHYNLGYEIAVAKRATLAINFNGLRGVHLLRSIDANAPIPGTFVRPVPDFNIIRRIESSGTSKSHGVDVTLRGKITSWFDASIYYRYRRIHSDVDSVDRLPANSRNLLLEWSRSDYDQPHRLNMAGVINFRDLFKTGIILSAASGRPYSIITGRDDNRDGIAADRPFGFRRNTEQGPGMLRLDVRWMRDFRILKPAEGEGVVASVAVDAFNVLNRVNYTGYVGNLSSPFFGQPTSAQAARRLQFSLRVRF